MLTNKYWGPIQENLDYISSLVKDGDNVLEIGPGNKPFSKATEFCGWTNEEQSRLGKYKVADVSKEMLPYKNKEFDFVYCRHVLEDLWNPINAIKEITRIAKRGYMETPSPLCEMTKGVDGGNNTPWRGYAHHRYIIWNDSNVLHILPKFPIIEHVKFQDESVMEQMLKNPFHWCTFFSFEDTIHYKLHEMGLEQDFTFIDDSYLKIINNAINTGIQNSNQQIEKVSQYYANKNRTAT